MLLAELDPVSYQQALKASTPNTTDCGAMTADATVLLMMCVTTTTLSRRVRSAVDRRGASWAR